MWRPDKKDICVILFSILLLVAVTRLFFFHPVDDAFISFRYARNFVAGNGFVFNPGERVEGYTNFLWILYLALPLLTGLDIAAFAMWSGLTFSCLSLILLFFLANRKPDRPRRYLPLFLFSTSPVITVWTSSGMEAPFFTFLVLSSFLLYFRERERERADGKPPFPLSAVFFALAGLARPEGVLIFFVTLLTRLLERDGSRKERFVSAAGYLAYFCLIGIPYFLWRWTYYGWLLPNTFYDKVGFTAYTFRHGVRYLTQFVTWSAGFVFLPSLLAAKRWKDERIRTLFLVVVLYCAYLIGVGGDFYFFSRFYFPMIPLLALLTQEGLLAMQGWFSARQARSSETLRGPWRAVAAALPLILFAVPFESHYYKAYRLGLTLDARRATLGRWLKKNIDPGMTLAMNAVGIVPFYSDLRTIDMLGLTDDTVSHRPPEFENPFLFGHHKQAADYVLSLRPDIIIAGEGVIFDVPDHQSALRQVGIIPFEYFQEYVRYRFNVFPGDWYIFNNPLFRERYAAIGTRIGDLHLFSFQYDKEAERWRKALTENPNNAEALAMLGKDYGEKGLYDRAEKLLARAKDLDFQYMTLYDDFRRFLEERHSWGIPESSSATAQDYLEKAGRLMKAGKLEEAKEMLEALVKIHSNAPTAYFNLGVIYEGEQNLTKAEDCYRKAIEYDHRYGDAYNNLGTLYAKMGKLDLAEENWRKALALNPASPARTNLLLLEEMKKR